MYLITRYFGNQLAAQISYDIQHNHKSCTIQFYIHDSRFGKGLQPHFLIFSAKDSLVITGAVVIVAIFLLSLASSAKHNIIQ